MRAIGFITCVLSLWSCLAFAQAPGASAPQAERSSSPDAQARLQGVALVRALRAGGLVIYFRHTATDFSRNDQSMRSYDDCANQRLLSEQGRADAKAIGQRITALKLPLGSVLASPMCRTMEHARLMFGTATPTAPMRERTEPNQYPGLKRLLSERVPDGSNRWMVGHGTPFRAVAGAPHLAEGEAIVLKPTGDGWVVLARLAVADWAALPMR
ncbi:MAG: histidine phosphatase family protein [Burkholderiaceae bacterium]|nr:histidine phosphatase family protein [Burkholderiaceae bacterium]